MAKFQLNFAKFRRVSNLTYVVWIWCYSTRCDAIASVCITSLQWC